VRHRGDQASTPQRFVRLSLIAVIWEASQLGSLPNDERMIELILHELSKGVQVDVLPSCISMNLRLLGLEGDIIPWAVEEKREHAYRVNSHAGCIVLRTFLPCVNFSISSQTDTIFKICISRPLPQGPILQTNQQVLRKYDSNSMRLYLVYSYLLSNSLVLSNLMCHEPTCLLVWSLTFAKSYLHIFRQGHAASDTLSAGTSFHQTFLRAITISMFLLVGLA